MIRRLSLPTSATQEFSNDPTKNKTNDTNENDKQKVFGGKRDNPSEKIAGNSSLALPVKNGKNREEEEQGRVSNSSYDPKALITCEDEGENEDDSIELNKESPALKSTLYAQDTTSQTSENILHENGAEYPSFEIDYQIDYEIDCEMDREYVDDSVELQSEKDLENIRKRFSLTLYGADDSS